MFLGKNIISTMVITIITLAIFATSVYGFSKVANLSNPIKDIPEVETVSQKETESPTPGLKSEENNQDDVAETPDPEHTASPTPLVPTASIQQHNSVQNKVEEHAQNIQPEVKTPEKEGSKIQVDNETDTNTYTDRTRTGSRD